MDVGATPSSAVDSKASGMTIAIVDNDGVIIDVWLR